ncbi:MAG: arginine N-succinyltransferase [Betaproteobacteria bacterium]
MKTWHIRIGGAADVGRVAGWTAQGGGGEPTPDDLWLVAEWRDSLAATPTPAASLKLRGGVGLRQIRYWYHVGCVVHAAPELQLFHRQSTLLMGNDYTGATELADAACDVAALTLAEQAFAWRLLLQSALLWLASGREPQRGPLIAELPGVRDAAGQSPFWQGLGAHFYAEDPLQAQRRFGLRWRSDVAALLPRHPVYTSFLPAPARAAIGQPAPEAQGWMSALVQAGMHYGNHVALHDGGPVFEAHVDTLPAMLQARRRALIRVDTPVPRSAWWVLLDEARREWRVVRAVVSADALRLVAGDAPPDVEIVWAAPLS